MGLPRIGATCMSRWIPTPFRSVLFCVAVSALTLLLLQPTSTEAARNEVGEAVIFASDPPFIRSHLYELQPQVVQLEEFRDSGGAIEPLGDKLLLVTPRGRIALIHADGEVSYLPQRVPMNESAAAEPITWIGFRVADILLHKQLPDRFRLFVSHHYFAGECVEFRISSALLTLEEEEVALSDNWKTEFRANPCIKIPVFGTWHGKIIHVGGGIQAGGRMLMDGAEHLLIAVGDHGWYEWHDRYEPDFAQKLPLVDPEYHLGKLVRIELAGGKAEVIASGFRNPQGLARDAEGNLWQTEHGPFGGDELNLLKPGLDYGWPYVTYGIQYGHRTWAFSEAQGRHVGFEEPVFAWTPSIAISNLIANDGQQFPLWQNDLLIGSLVGRSLFRVRVRQERAVYVERIGIGERIRDIIQMPDGRIALLSDSAKILFLQRAPIYCHDQSDAESIFTYDAAEVCKDVTGVIKEADDPLVRALDGAELDTPVIRSLFNVYIDNSRIVYVKSPCSEHDLSHRFFLHITPVHSEDLAEEHELLGSNVYDFYSSDNFVGTAINENGCLIARVLPQYELGHIYTGQVVRVVSAEGEVSWKGPIWEADYTSGDFSPGDMTKEEETPPVFTDEQGNHLGAPLFASRCSSCHNLVAEHGIGPHLENVIGRRAGRVDGFSGSTALTSLDLFWTRENLAVFIANPTQFAPGTTMADTGISAEEARIIADFLAMDQ